MSPAGALSSTGFGGLRGPEHRDTYAVRVTGAGVLDEFLFVNYAVSPVPDALAGQAALLEGESAGIAIDSAKRTYSDCRSGYRVSRTSGRLVGALRIGRAQWRGLGEVAVLFAPFAHTLGLRRVLCELTVTIDDAERVDVTSLRGPESI